MEDDIESTEPQESSEQPQETGSVAPDKDARVWAMFCHLAGLAVCVFPFAGNIILPLILWQIKKEQYPFVDDQGKEAVNFQISVTIYGIVAAITVIGMFLLPVIGIGALVLLIIAAIKANNGEAYRYPLTIRFIK